MRSLKYKYWKSVIDLRRCMDCKKQQGKICILNDIIPEEPPLHNYSSGFRGGERIFYSNDGLIFATYDHYVTFVEIV